MPRVPNPHNKNWEHDDFFSIAKRKLELVWGCEPDSGVMPGVGRRRIESEVRRREC